MADDLTIVATLQEHGLPAMSVYGTPSLPSRAPAEAK